MRAAAAGRGSGGDVARQRCFRVSGGAAGRVAAATTPSPLPPQGSSLAPSGPAPQCSFCTGVAVVDEGGRVAGGRCVSC